MRCFFIKYKRQTCATDTVECESQWIFEWMAKTVRTWNEQGQKVQSSEMTNKLKSFVCCLVADWACWVWEPNWRTHRTRDGVVYLQTCWLKTNADKRKKIIIYIVEYSITSNLNVKVKAHECIYEKAHGRCATDFAPLPNWPLYAIHS